MSIFPISAFILDPRVQICCIGIRNKDIPVTTIASLGLKIASVVSYLVKSPSTVLNASLKFLMSHNFIVSSQLLVKSKFPMCEKHILDQVVSTVVS
nr:unnamed protein product [Callosobruchus chinensis]